MIIKLPHIFASVGCGTVHLEDPEFDIVSLADRQTIQTDLSPLCKEAWRWLVKRYPKQIELIGGVGDYAHSTRRSCHNVIRDQKGRVLSPAKALDVQPIGLVGSPEFISLGTKMADDVWANFPSASVQIWRRRIRSRGKKNGAWRPYLGINGHFKHFHTSYECNG